MLSQTVEYALRAVVCLARQNQQFLTTAELSRLTQVPPSYLSKVMQSLVRAGLAAATRGIHGGYTLAVSPERLDLLQVVNAIDPVKRIDRCPLGIESHHNLCPLHRRLDELARGTQEAFSKTTVAQLLLEEDAMDGCTLGATPCNPARHAPAPLKVMARPTRA